MNITVYPMSNVLHLQQIFCGFDGIGRFADVNVRYRYDGRSRYAVNPDSEFDHRAFAVLADVDGVFSVVFDTHDSAAIVEPLYERCDYYFKRSYHPAEHAHLAKAMPLGVNLEVSSSRFSLAPLARLFRLGFGRPRPRDVARALHLPRPFVPDERTLSSIARPSDEPRVLFLTRAWEPGGSKQPTPERTRERQAINDSRAECVRALRGEFGDLFRGGFEGSAYSREHYPDIIVERTYTNRAAYLREVRATDICITTMGLHRSTGWKFAEYLALGRAIVCEPHVFDPGDGLIAGENFLEFRTPDECVAAVRRLMDDKGLRARMMTRNAAYYRDRVAPESLVVSALARATRAASAAAPRSALN